MQDSSFTHVFAKGPYAGLLQSCIRAFRQNVCKSIWAFNLILLYCRAKYCINPYFGLMQYSKILHKSPWDLCRTGTYAGLIFHTHFREKPLCRTQVVQHKGLSPKRVRNLSPAFDLVLQKSQVGFMQYFALQKSKIKLRAHILLHTFWLKALMLDSS